MTADPLTVLVVVAAALAGLVAGSFATTLAVRVPDGRSVLRPPGRCPDCGAALRAADLVPVVGWVRLRGKCRACGQPFGCWYPAAEVITCALFAGLAVRFGPSAALPAFCYLAAVAVALAVIDLKRSRLPDLLTLPSYPVALALLLVAAPFIPNGWSRVAHGLIGLVVLGAFYLLLAVVYPSGIGWGDVKLSGVLGLYLGWCGARVFVAGALAGFLLAAVTGIGLIAARRASRKTQIPFGPFMLAGALGAILASGILGTGLP
jgi:leader peptidase (prepilin peptidase) / N-methyltransferase